MTMQVELVSPEAAVWSGEATQVIARTLGGGDIAFLTGHAPFLGGLDTCVITVTLTDGTLEKIAVRGGFVEVNGTHVKILSDEARPARHVDPDAARAALHRAQEILKADEENSDAAGDVRWHEIQLRAAGHDASGSDRGH